MSESVSPAQVATPTPSRWRPVLASAVATAPLAEFMR